MESAKNFFKRTLNTKIMENNVVRPLVVLNNNNNNKAKRAWLQETDALKEKKERNDKFVSFLSACDHSRTFESNFKWLSMKCVVLGNFHICSCSLFWFGPKEIK